MSNKTQLQTNNNNLDALITRVNAAKDVAASLPEAGGGGEANYETCTLTINANYANDGGVTSYAYTTIENGNIVSYYNSKPNSTFTLSCLCNSIIVIQNGILQLTNYFGVELQSILNTMYIFKITASNAQIDLVGGGGSGN